jgi:hypothetical protein
MLKIIAPFLIAAALVGCSGSEGVSLPTSPSSTLVQPQVLAPQAVPLQLRGFVMDTAFRPVPGARIEVVDGASAGTSVIAGNDGAFVLSGMFHGATQFRAVKEGHEPRTQPWNCAVAVCLGPNNAQPWLGFYLTVLEPTVNIAGEYTLTFTADSTCADLPEIARSRSYGVTVTAQPADGRTAIPGFEVKANGGRFLSTLDGFSIGAAANRLSFWLHARHDPTIVEDLGNNTYLAFSGVAETTASRDALSPITAAFDGWIEHLVLATPLTGPWYYPQPPASTSMCDSSNHRVTLTRAH